MAVIGVSPALAAPEWWKSFDREVLSRVDISGYRRLGYHSHFVTGDREAFDTTNYFGQGDQRFTDIGQISLSGRRVWRVLNFDATILDSRINDPQGQRFSIDVDQGQWTLNAGDIQGRLLNTNPLASFNKSLRGVSVGYQSEGFAARAVYSEAKGSARTVSLNGNNSSGPYYLQNSQIVQGSERIEIDGQEMRLGIDYVINYEVGSITFIDRIVSVTSTIVATYEALGFNARAGVVQGLGVSYDFGDYGRVGLTAMQQLSRSGGGASTRLEKFQGFGAASTPYFLQFEPLTTAPVTIRVNGVVQTEGIDYTFDPDNPAVFYFTRFMAPENDIDVVYTPRPRGTADGDRENLGVDYRLPLGRGQRGDSGAIVLSQSVGRLTNSATPRSGTARQAQVNYRWGDAVFSASVRDVPDTFVSVETRGFSRNEKASVFNVVVSPQDSLEYGLRWQNSAIAQRRTDNNGDVQLDRSRATSTRGYANFSIPDFGRWELAHTRTRSRYSAGTSNVDSTELFTTRQLGPLDLRFTLDRQVGRGPFGSGTNARQAGFAILGADLALGYRPTDVLSFQGSYGISEIEADGEHGFGRDLAISGSYVPSNAWSVQARYALSDSGRIATLGRFQNGFGLGFGGNGFTGGGDFDAVTGSTDLESLRLSVDHRPNDRLGLDLRVFKQAYSGSVSSNSSTSGWGVGGTYDLGAGHTVSAGVDFSETSFVQSDQRSDASTFDLFYNATPAGRFSYNLGINTLLTGGTSAFQQDSTSFRATLSYLLDDRQNLSFIYRNGRITGYLPQDDFDAGLVYQYRLFSDLALNVSYWVREVNNRDASLTSGAYRSGGLDIELEFNFGR